MAPARRSSGWKRSSIRATFAGVRGKYPAFEGGAAGALIAVVFIARVLLVNTAPHDADEFMFALGGRGVLQGHLPPDGVFDNKPIGLLYLFALAELVGGQTVAAIQGLGLLCAALTTMLVFWTARRARASSGLALALAALVSIETVCFGGWLTLSELVAGPLIAGANLLLLEPERGRARTVVGAGILFGMACQVTYLAVPLAALACASLFLGGGSTLRPSCLKALRFALATAGTILVIWAPQMLSGEWLSYVTQQAIYHAQYRQAHQPFARVLVTMIGPLGLATLPFLVIFLDFRGAVGAAKSVHTGLLAMQIAGALLAAMMSNQFYSHYLILALPALTVLLGLLVSSLSAHHQRLGVVVCLTCAAVFILPNAAMLRGWPTAAALEQRSAAAINARIGRDQPVLVFDESPMIYYLSGSQVAGRIAFVSHYMPTCLEVPMATPQSVLAEALSQNAKLILVGDQCHADFDAGAMVRRAGYGSVGHIAEGGRSIDVYARLTR